MNSNLDFKQVTDLAHSTLLGKLFPMVIFCSLVY